MTITTYASPMKGSELIVYALKRHYLLGITVIAQMVAVDYEDKIVKRVGVSAHNALPDLSLVKLTVTREHENPTGTVLTLHGKSKTYSNR